MCTQNKYDVLNLICENCNNINQHCKCENTCTIEHNFLSIDNNYSLSNLKNAQFDNNISISCLSLHETPTADKGSNCTGSQNNETTSKRENNMTQIIDTNKIASNQPNNPCPIITDNRISKHNNTFSFNTKGLHIGSLNIQNILPKLDELKYILSQKNTCDVLGIVETFLTSNTNKNELCITNFNFERRDRESKNGGGVLVFIRNTIPYKRRFDLETDDIESIRIEINLPTCKPFILNFLYRPPDSKQDWIYTFESQLVRIDKLNIEAHFLGDFNINFSMHGDVPNYANKLWGEIILRYDLNQMIKLPTRITKSSSTIIDHLYSTRSDVISDVHVPGRVMYKRSLSNMFYKKYQ